MDRTLEMKFEPWTGSLIGNLVKALEPQKLGIHFRRVLSHNGCTYTHADAISSRYNASCWFFLLRGRRPPDLAILYSDCLDTISEFYLR